MAMTFFQIGTVCCRPLAGRLIDSVHKGRLMLGATLAFFAIMVAFCFAHTEEALYGLRLLHGIQFALGTTAAATLAALVLPAAKKGTGIGYFALSTNLAMVVGPLVGLLVIRSFGTLAMFLCLAASALLTVWLANRRTLDAALVRPEKKKEGGARFSLVERRALPMAALGGLVFFAYGGVLTFIPLYARSIGLEASVSLFFAVFALVIVLTRPFVGRLFDKKGFGLYGVSGFGALPRRLPALRHGEQPGALPPLGGCARCGFRCCQPRLSDARCCKRAACACRPCDSDLLLGARHQRRPCRRLPRPRRRPFRLRLPLRPALARRPPFCRRLLCSLAQAGKTRRKPNIDLYEVKMRKISCKGGTAWSSIVVYAASP